MNSPHVAQKNKNPFNYNLKNFLSRAKSTKKKLFFYLIIFIILFVPSLAAFYIAPLIKAANTTPSFSFTAGGDIGGSSNSSTALDLIAQSGSQFDLALGDLSYSEITPESNWCSYVQSRVGSNFPFELLSGNHEDGGEIQDGLIDNFNECLPDRL